MYSSSFHKFHSPPLCCSSCQPDSLAGQSYRGKILFCPRGSNGTGPLQAGAAGTVIANAEPDVAFVFPLPAVTIAEDQFTEILAYVNRTRYEYEYHRK